MIFREYAVNCRKLCFEFLFLLFHVGLHFACTLSLIACTCTCTYLRGICNVHIPLLYALLIVCSYEHKYIYIKKESDLINISKQLETADNLYKIPSLARNDFSFFFLQNMNFSLCHISAVKHSRKNILRIDYV